MEKAFVPVAQIKLGMHVVEADGQLGVISGWKVVPGVKTMYNLEVAQDHTFVVGVGMWIVHNCGPTGTPDPANKIAGQPDLYKGQQYDPNASNNLEDQGYKMVPNKGPEGTNTRYSNSPNFFEYLRSQGKSTSGWYYRMETWVKPGADPIVNHYWTDGVGNFFHHHP